MHALALRLVLDHEPPEYFAIQAAQRRGRQHAFGSSARAHHGVHAGTRHRRRDSGREIAIADQADARARLADIRDELLMPRPVEHHHHHVVHAPLQAPGDGLQVVFHRSVQIDSAFRRRTDDDLLHVAVGRVQQATAFSGRQHRNRPAGAGRAEIGAFERIDRDIHRERAGLILRRAEFFTDVEHRRLVALALADHNRAVDGDVIEAAPHALDCRLIGGVRVAHTHGARRRDGRIFHHAQNLQREVEHARFSPHGR